MLPAGFYSVHHLYLLTAVVREAFPQYKTAAICHGTGLRQIKKNSLEREYILAHIKELHKVFCLHREQREEISRIYGVPGERLEVIGSGFDDSIFRFTPVKKDDGAKRLIYAGKLSEKKGIMSLLRSLAYLEQMQRQDGEQQRQAAGQSAEPVKIEVWLAGGYGNQLEYETIKKLAGQSPYPVKFLGRLDQPRLAERMNQADVFVLPSFYEGLPLVVIEALACGLQVVCTDLPGVRPWLEENIGTCPVKFVSLPAIVNADEPVEQELPEFERRLAEAIGKSLGMNGGSLGTDGGSLETDGGGLSTHGGENMDCRGPVNGFPSPDLSRISWAGISKKNLRNPVILYKYPKIWNEKWSIILCNPGKINLKWEKLEIFAILEYDERKLKHEGLKSPKEGTIWVEDAAAGHTAAAGRGLRETS